MNLQSPIYWRGEVYRAAMHVFHGNGLERRYQHILKFVSKGDSVLDVGCGTGILLPYLLEMYPQAACMVEFDFAEAMLAENARKFSDNRVWRICGDVQNLPFVGPSLDLVLCFSVLPHLGDTVSAVGKLYKALRPKGVLTVGHMTASKELNEFHGSLNGPIMHDKLLPAGELGEILRRLGAAVVCEEEADWYFVRAEKESA